MEDKNTYFDFKVSTHIRIVEMLLQTYDPPLSSCLI
jgi:hypothetical protein